MKQPRLIDINSKWYKPHLMPNYKRPVLLQKSVKSPDGFGLMYNYDAIILHELTGKERWEDEKKDGLIKWAYIEDLKPRNL